MAAACPDASRHGQDHGHGGLRRCDAPEIRCTLERRAAASTVEHHAFLERVIERMSVEARVEQRGRPGDASEEPVFDSIQGVPDCERPSRMFRLGCTECSLCASVSFDNAMVALINGTTIHHLSGIIAAQAERASPTRDKCKVSTRCQCLRFLVVYTTRDHTELRRKAQDRAQDAPQRGAAIIGGVNRLLISINTIVSSVSSSPCWPTSVGRAVRDIYAGARDMYDDTRGVHT